MDLFCSGSGYIWIFHTVSKYGLGGFPDGMVLDCPCSSHRTIKQNSAVRPVQISCDSCSFSDCARWGMDSFVRLTEPGTYITFCTFIFRSGKRNDLNFESCDDRTSMKTWSVFNFFWWCWRSIFWILALWRFSGLTTFSISGPLFVDSIANSVMKTCIHIFFAVQEDRKYLPGSRICQLLLPWHFANIFRFYRGVYSVHICFRIRMRWGAEIGNIGDFAFSKDSLQNSLKSGIGKCFWAKISWGLTRPSDWETQQPS
jgi:hypothetical protein